MGAEFVRVDNYVKPSKWHWFKAALWSVVSLRFFIDLFRLLEYYTAVSYTHLTLPTIATV